MVAFVCQALVLLCWCGVSIKLGLPYSWGGGGVTMYEAWLQCMLLYSGLTVTPYHDCVGLDVCIIVKQLLPESKLACRQCRSSCQIKATQIIGVFCQPGSALLCTVGSLHPVTKLTHLMLLSDKLRNHYPLAAASKQVCSTAGSSANAHCGRGSPGQEGKHNAMPIPDDRYAASPRARKWLRSSSRH
jgi:hypothetical protein